MQRMLNLIFPYLLVDQKNNNPTQFFEAGAMMLAYMHCLLMPNSRKVAITFVARRVQFERFWIAPLLLLLIVVLSMAFVAPDTKNAFIYFEF
jgi:hypothetical protein